MAVSIVEYFSDHSGYRCGYCHSTDSNFSHGMWAHSLTPLDYQDLIDRGWRRSGQYCYKPTMNKVCCPMYPIRCAALNFKPSKSHKKVMKKMRNYLEDNRISGGSARSDYQDDGSERMEEGDSAGALPNESAELEMRSRHLEEKLHMDKKQKLASASPNTGSSSQCTAAAAKEGAERSKPEVATSSDSRSKPEINGCSSNGSNGNSTLRTNQPKAKEIRLNRWREKQAAKGMIVDISPAATAKQAAGGNQEKTLDDWLTYKSDGKHTFEIRLVYTDSELFEKTFDESLKVYQKYQMNVHGDKLSDCTAKQFQRFLCKSPLKDSNPRFGSFHRQYLIDGKIVAVGVIDILPNCVSSVYLYYDTDYSFLSLGTYTSLSEIAFVRQLCASIPSLQYYYLGFYIHSCPKMRYKGQYSPSYLACPETYSWCPLDACTPLLDRSKYARLDSAAGNRDPARFRTLSDVRVLFEHKVMFWDDYVVVRDEEEADEIDSEVTEYASLVGSSIASRMMLYRAK